MNSIALKIVAHGRPLFQCWRLFRSLNETFDRYLTHERICLRWVISAARMNAQNNCPHQRVFLLKVAPLESRRTTTASRARF